MKELNLYLINSDGEIYYVIAKNYQSAIEYWAAEEAGRIEPDHVSKVADYDHVLGI